MGIVGKLKAFCVATFDFFCYYLSNTRHRSTNGNNCVPFELSSPPHCMNEFLTLIFCTKIDTGATLALCIDDLPRKWKTLFFPSKWCEYRVVIFVSCYEMETYWRWELCNGDASGKYRKSFEQYALISCRYVSISSTVNRIYWMGSSKGDRNY